jgi:hypothetical protein
LIILADEGKVLSWGFGGHGQLGHSSIQSQKIPAVIDALADQCVIYIACGGSSSAAITGELRYDLKMHFQYLFFNARETLQSYNLVDSTRLPHTLAKSCPSGKSKS